MTRSRLVAVMVLGCTTCLSMRNISGAELFSVNASTDELVKIDTTTGSVATVGVLDFDVIDVDLARIDDRLFALNTDFGNDVVLVELNRTTGETISSVQVTHGGNAITSAEGLGAIGDELLIGFSVATDAFSESLGVLSMDGAITNVRSFNAEDDFDGLGSNCAGNGPLYSTDAQARPAPYSTNKYFIVDQSGPPLIEIASFPVSQASGNDLVVSDLTLFAIDAAQSVLFKIKLPEGSLIESIALDGNVFRGLAEVIDSDVDCDWVSDSADNCTTIANANQRDTDYDGIGNACDADLTNDCMVNFGDLAALKAVFFPRPYNATADFNGDGFVNFNDLAIMKSTFFNGENPGPGPSGMVNDCD